MLRGGFMATLEELAGDLLRSEGIRWFIRNRKKLFWTWIVLVVVIFVAMVALDYDTQRAAALERYNYYGKRGEFTFQWNPQKSINTAFKSVSSVHLWALLILGDSAQTEKNSHRRPNLPTASCHGAQGR